MEGPPNHPKTFGEELRRLRESAGLSLEDIAEETKISKRILNNLEAGDFRFLPQMVFSRNSSPSTPRLSGPIRIASQNHSRRPGIGSCWRPARIHDS